MKTIISDIIIKTNIQVKRISAISIDLVDQKFNSITEYKHNGFGSAKRIPCYRYYPEVIGIKIGYLDDSGHFSRTLLIKTKTIELASKIYNNEILDSIPIDDGVIILDIRYRDADLVLYEGKYRYNTDVCGPIPHSIFQELFEDQYEKYKEEIESIEHNQSDDNDDNTIYSNDHQKINNSYVLKDIIFSLIISIVLATLSIFTYDILFFNLGIDRNVLIVEWFVIAFASFIIFVYRKKSNQDDDKD